MMHHKDMNEIAATSSLHEDPAIVETHCETKNEGPVEVEEQRMLFWKPFLTAALVVTLILLLVVPITIILDDSNEGNDDILKQSLRHPFNPKEGGDSGNETDFNQTAVGQWNLSESDVGTESVQEPTLSCPTLLPIDVSDMCAKSVESIQALPNRTYMLPEHVLDDQFCKYYFSNESDGMILPDLRPDLDFNVSKYFTIFTHLEMEEGSTLDYKYYLNCMVGFPELFVHQGDENIYNDYINHVLTDGSAEGYFQLTLLKIVGDKFYQYWEEGALDGKNEVICNQNMAVSMLRALSMLDEQGNNNSMPLLTRQDLDLVNQIDFRPTVECDTQGNFRVKVVSIAKQGAIIRKIYTISQTTLKNSLEWEWEQDKIMFRYDENRWILYGE